MRVYHCRQRAEEHVRPWTGCLPRHVDRYYGVRGVVASCVPSRACSEGVSTPTRPPHTRPPVNLSTVTRSPPRSHAHAHDYSMPWRRRTTYEQTCSFSPDERCSSMLAQENRFADRPLTTALFSA